MKTLLYYCLINIASLFLYGCNDVPTTQILIKKTTIPLLADGQIDHIWDSCAWEAISHIRFTRKEQRMENPHDLSAAYKSMWDDQYWYFLFKIVDNKKYVIDAQTDIEKAYDLKINDLDGIDLFFDNFKKLDPETKFKDLTYLRLTYGSDTIRVLGKQQISPEPLSAIQSSYQDLDSGYLYTCKIPWTVLGIKPEIGTKIGLELNVVDNDGEVVMPGAQAKKKTIVAWADQTRKNPFIDKYIYGQAILQ